MLCKNQQLLTKQPQPYTIQKSQSKPNLRFENKTSFFPEFMETFHFCLCSISIAFLVCFSLVSLVYRTLIYKKSNDLGGNCTPYVFNEAPPRQAGSGSLLLHPAWQVGRQTERQIDGRLSTQAPLCNYKPHW